MLIWNGVALDSDVAIWQRRAEALELELLHTKQALTKVERRLATARKKNRFYHQLLKPLQDQRGEWEAKMMLEAAADGYGT